MTNWESSDEYRRLFWTVVLAFPPDLIDRVVSDCDTELFDRLPKPIRQAIASCPFGATSDMVLPLLTQYDWQSIRFLIFNHQDKILQSCAKRYKAQHHEELPHIAAEAQLMYTQPINPAVARPRKRRQTWQLRTQQRMTADETMY